MKVLIAETEIQGFKRRGDILKEHALKLDDFCTRVFLSYSSKVTALVKLDQQSAYLNDKAWETIHNTVSELNSLKDELQSLRADIVTTLKTESKRED